VDTSARWITISAELDHFIEFVDGPTCMDIEATFLSAVESSTLRMQGGEPYHSDNGAADTDPPLQTSKSPVRLPAQRSSEDGESMHPTPREWAHLNPASTQRKPPIPGKVVRGGRFEAPRFPVEIAAARKKDAETLGRHRRDLNPGPHAPSASRRPQEAGFTGPAGPTRPAAAVPQEGPPARRPWASSFGAPPRAGARTRGLAQITQDMQALLENRHRNVAAEVKASVSAGERLLAETVRSPLRLEQCCGLSSLHVELGHVFAQ
jgi:hypothetical protein